MTWSWTAIEPDEELAGDELPAPEDVPFHERRLALVLLAKQTNAGTTRQIRSASSSAICRSSRAASSTSCSFPAASERLNRA